MKIARIYRLLRLITMLQGKRTYTAQELADDLDVSRRTVFRDLNVLEMAHVPYYFHSDTGGYRIDPHPGCIQPDRQFNGLAICGLPMNQIFATGVAEVVVGAAIRSIAPNPRHMKIAVRSWHRFLDIGIHEALPLGKRAIT